MGKNKPIIGLVVGILVGLGLYFTNFQDFPMKATSAWPSP